MKINSIIAATFLVFVTSSAFATPQKFKCGVLRDLLGGLSNGGNDILTIDGAAVDLDVAGSSETIHMVLDQNASKFGWKQYQEPGSAPTHLVVDFLQNDNGTVGSLVGEVQSHPIVMLNLTATCTPIGQ